MLGMILSAVVAGTATWAPAEVSCRFPAAQPGDPTVTLQMQPVPEVGGRMGSTGLRILLDGQAVLAGVRPVAETPARDWMVQRSEADGRLLVLALNADGRALLVRQWPGTAGTAARTDRRTGACDMGPTDLAEWLPS